MNSLMIFCPSTGGHEANVTSWQDTMSKPWPIVVDDQTEGEDAGFLVKCDKAWRKTDATVIGYLHSDLTIHEHSWDERVLREFDDPRVGVVGFVGATGLGHENIYKTRYDFKQLARCDVWSNLTDWSSHGQHLTGTRDVAVIDSCAVFVRRDFLTRVGGWPVGRYPNSSHCSDLWLCCMCRRYDQRVRVVGVTSTHASGGRGAVGEAWLSARGTDAEGFHRPAHRLIYDDFRDVLPIRI